MIALASVIVLGVPLGLVEAARVRSDQTSRLEREADSVAGAIDDRLEAHQPLLAASLSRFVRTGHRVVITERTGKRLSVGSSFAGPVMRAHSGSARGASVIAEAPESDSGDRVRRAWLLIVALAVGGVAAAVALAFIQARRLARPLESLAGSSARLGEGDFSVRAGRFAIPEVDALAHVLDLTAERVARLVAREREFSANASHQLRTPLTGLKLRLEAARDGSTDPAVDEQLAAAEVETERLARLLTGLLTLARAGESSPAQDAPIVSLAEVAETAYARWRATAEREGRALELRPGQAAEVGAAEEDAASALDNLVENALRYSPARTAVTIEYGVDGREGWIRVLDEGPGVSPEEAEHVFERFARGEAGRGVAGTGLGLAIVRALAERWGGTATLASRPGGGAQAELRLPLATVRDALPFPNPELTGALRGPG